MDATLVIAEWRAVENTDIANGPTGYSWQGPPGALGCIDLQPMEEIEDATRSPDRNRGAGIFVMPKGTRGSEFDVIGDGDPRGMPASPATRSMWLSRTGIRAGGDTLAALLIDHLMSSPSPLVPNRQRRLRVFLGGEKFYDRPFSIAASTKHADLVRRQVQANYETLLTLGETKARQGYDATIDKFFRLRHPYQRLAVHEEVKKHLLPPARRANHPGPLAHSTTFGPDDMSGTHSDDWTDEGGTWANDAGEKGKNAGGNAYHVTRWNVNHSSDDFWAEASVNMLNRFHGPAVRIPSGANTCYVAAKWSGVNRIAKIVAAARTDLVTTNFDSGYSTLRLQANGSELEWWEGGVSEGTHTDTAISGNNYPGLHRWSAATDEGLDDWESQDLAAAVPPVMMHAF